MTQPELICWPSGLVLTAFRQWNQSLASGPLTSTTHLAGNVLALLQSLPQWQDGQSWPTLINSYPYSSISSGVVHKLLLIECAEMAHCEGFKAIELRHGAWNALRMDIDMDRVQHRAISRCCINKSVTCCGCLHACTLHLESSNVSPDRAITWLT